MKDEREASPPDGRPFITLEDVALRVGGRLLFEHIRWEIKSDQHWAVIGPNGSGKSTLVNAIFREVPVVRGRILYFFERNGGDGHSRYDQEELLLKAHPC